MSRRTWAEYLDDAGTHLEASRAAISDGRAVPPSPVRPVDPIPVELCDQARAVGLGYDVLATEVATRMAELRRPRSLPSPWVLSEARFVDRYA
jgi:hypothetical protein